MYFFAIFHFFSVTFLPAARKIIYIDTNNNSHQIVQKIVDKKDNFSFSSMLFACRNLLLIAKKIKKSLSSFEDEITVDDRAEKKLSAFIRPKRFIEKKGGPFDQIKNLSKKIAVSKKR